MHFTIEQLIMKNDDILTWYSRAKEIWEGIFQTINPANASLVNELAKELFNKQLQFEHECGGRWIGQEIMVVSGIGQFYSTQMGFDQMNEKYKEKNLKLAMNLYVAIQLSYCSIEVKEHARDVANSYGLEADWS